MPQTAAWIGKPSIKGSTESIRMALLTTSLIGLQFTWGLEMSYCTPYLLELGLSKSKVSLVWVAGPLSGLIMAPLVGIIADKSTSKWGRRRPFMMYGTVLVVACLIVLGWTREIVALFVGDKETHKSLTIAVAVLSIYAVDFAINAVQSSCRALVADTLPISKQQLGSSWASRMVATGSLLGYAAGAIDLSTVFGNSIGDTQFKRLTALACLVLTTAISITSYCVNERVLVLKGEPDDKIGPAQMFKDLLKKAMDPPKRIAAICQVQLWAWIGWFPFMFYNTTWIGEVYLRYDAPHVANQGGDTLGQVGRVGSRSLITFAVVTWIGTVVFPFFIRTPQQSRKFPPPRLAEGPGLVEALDKYKPSLQTAWMYGHLIFTGSMLWAPQVTSVHLATLLVAFCGIAWAIQCWSPFTFIGIEVNRLSEPGHGYADDRVRMDIGSNSANGTPLTPKASLLDDESQNTASEHSGVYIGILNVYTTISQFVACLISFVVFSVLEPGKSPELAKEAHPDEHAPKDGYNGISVCFFIGALSLARASLATRQYRRMGE